MPGCEDSLLFGTFCSGCEVCKLLVGGGSVFSPRCVVSVLSVDLYHSMTSLGISFHSVKSLSCFRVFITRCEFLELFGDLNQR